MENKVQRNKWDGDVLASKARRGPPLTHVQPRTMRNGFVLNKTESWTLVLDPSLLDLGVGPLLAGPWYWTPPQSKSSMETCPKIGRDQRGEVPSFFSPQVPVGTTHCPASMLTLFLFLYFLEATEQLHCSNKQVRSEREALSLSLLRKIRLPISMQPDEMP